MTQPIAPRTWRASKYDEEAGERISRLIPVYIHSVDGVELRTLGAVVDYMTSMESRMHAMGVAMEANRR